MNSNCLSTLWSTLHTPANVGRGATPPKRTGASPFKETMRALQALQLRDYLRTVILPFHPFYREKFNELGLTWHSVRTLDDLRFLPFTSKKDLVGGVECTRAFTITPIKEVLA